LSDSYDLINSSVFKKIGSDGDDFTRLQRAVPHSSSINRKGAVQLSSTKYWEQPVP